jgi:hypothetical protein
MHEVGILEAVCERAKLRRGGIAVFNHLNPRQTAHIVVDLQNGFMGQGQAAEVPMARTGALSAMAHVFCDVRNTQSLLGLIAVAPSSI